MGQNPSGASTAERRARDLRGLLVKTGGRSAVQELTRALSADGGALVRGCARAAPDVRDHLVRAAIEYANVAREHAVTSSSGLALLARSARWSAVATALVDKVTSSGLGADAERDLKLAQLASSAARLDLMGALTLSKSAAETMPDPAIAARLEAGVRALDARLAARRQAARISDDEDEQDDSEEGDPS
jgi:hypothetical protein